MFENRITNQGLGRIQRIISAVLVMLCVVAFQSGAFADDVSPAKGFFFVSTGQGEFRNVERTDRTEIRARYDIGAAHVAMKHEMLTAKPVDNARLSLIDGNSTSFGVGLHSNKGTDLTLYLNKDYWNIELLHKSAPIRWGLYPVLGVTHLDHRKRKTAKGFKRKTTGFVVGVGKQFSRNIFCEATVTTRNNGRSNIDDYVQAGCGYRF